ncbi:hypothetical protein V8G54_025955 [Vigna mungo]|uniref:Uncharacterized protein n=1 Tax=Vigna mungo TaxID=3915 RepID=A0AAQ3N045_VIGMU
MRIPRHETIVVHNVLVTRSPPPRRRRWRRRWRLAIDAGNGTLGDSVRVSALLHDMILGRRKRRDLVVVSHAVGRRRGRGPTCFEIHVSVGLLGLGLEAYLTRVAGIGLARKLGPEARFLGPGRRRHCLGVRQRRRWPRPRSLWRFGIGIGHR